MPSDRSRRAGGVLRALGHRAAVVVAATALVAAVTGPAPATAASDDVPGLTPKEIRIGAVVGKTNPTGVKYTQVVDGAQLYFDKVNKAGGIGGRKFTIVKVLDDQTRSSKSILAARSLVEENNVFAALVASQDFTGADVFVEAGTPVFGWNIQSQWSKGPNLFGTYGSYLCLRECPQFGATYAAQQLGAKHVAIFAYGSTPQSADCAKSSRDAFDKWGPKVAVFDTSISFGFSANDISGAVQEIKEKGVDFISTCMDIQGTVALRRALEAAGVNGVRFYAPQGYDGDTLEELGDDLEGFTFLALFTPFESAAGNPAMKEFLSAVKAKGLEPSENLLVGWVGAKLLTEGIRASGKGLTQDSVVEAINQITNWTADGMVRPVNWTTAHGPSVPGDTDCYAFVVVENGKFVPKYGQPGKPFVCIPNNPYPTSLDDHTYVGG